LTKIEYPDEITRDNLPKLVEKAKETKKKANIVIYSAVAIYCVIEVVFLLIGFPAWTYFVIRTSPPMSTQTALIISIVSFLIIYWMISFVLLDGIESAMKRILHVNYKEWFFGECVLIINNRGYPRTMADHPSKMTRWVVIQLYYIIKSMIYDV
jgi:hypothetical protein